MRTFILYGLLAIILLSAASNNQNYSTPPSQQGNSQCSEDGYATATVTSKEEMNQSGVFTFDVTITAWDTIWLDSVSFTGDTRCRGRAVRDCLLHTDDTSA